MLELTREQLETLDRIYEQSLERRVVQAMVPMFGTPSGDSTLAAPLGDAVRAAREHAARLDVAIPADFAALAAFFAGYGQLPKTDMAKIRESIGPLFTRSGSPAATVLALVQARMQALAPDHPSVARMLSQMATLRRAFE